MSQTSLDQPWLSLPAQISEQLRPKLGEIVEAIIESIPHDVPVYAMPMEGRFGQGVRRGVTVALSRFLDLPGTNLPALSEDGRWVYEGLGRGEVRSGRSLEALLAAYRSGARIALRAISSRADLDQLPPESLLALGESLFAYIDELSAASAQGYALEQSERAGEQQRQRAALVDMMLRGDASEATVSRAASAVGWTLPETVVVSSVPFSHADGLRVALGPATLVVERGTDIIAVTSYANRRTVRRELDRALRGRYAVVGPPRPWQKVGESLHLALSAAANLEPTGGADDGEDQTRSAELEPVWVEDRLAELVVRAEPIATADLARRRLAPLDTLRPTVRERLAETLLAWLRHHGQRAPIAAELFVHPQTVGYRVAQLKELFGAALDDPEARFELELVLRAGHR